MITSLRIHLIIVTLATLLPMVVLGIAGAALAAQRETAIFERGAVERTRAVVTAIDTELRGHQNSLNVLAESLNLEEPEFSAIRSEFVRTLHLQPDWYRIDLADPAGHRLIDSSSPDGAPPGRIVEPVSFREAVQSRKPVVSSLFREDNKYQFAVRVPVIRNGELRYVLSAIVEPSAILGILTSQQLPSDWVGVVVDRNRRIVARTMKNEQRFGQPASESLRAAMDRQPQGWFHGQTLEGAPVYTPYMASDFSGWTLAFGIPEEVVGAGGSTALTLLALSVLAAAGLAMFLARIMSRRISTPIASLAKTAKALGRGEPVSMPDAGSVAEVHEMGHALLNAAKAVQEREEALRAADRAKDHFLAMLGHELRNPLSSLYTAAQVLQMTEKRDGRAGQAAEIVDRQVKHMTRLVDDLLDVARVTTGKVKLKRQPLDLAGIVERSVDDLRESGRLSDHDLHVDLSPVWVQADKARVDQIVSNLVGNAIKYTPAGGRIDVRVTREESEAVLEVSDSGSGLSPELATRVFDLFVQGEQALDRATGGLGVGLTLVKQLAQLHGGDAKAFSAGPDLGTRITVTFPAIDRPDLEERPASRTVPDGHGRRVLLIEDNEDARAALARVLEHYGYEVLEAADGASGLDIAAKTPTSVAVVDIGLPGMDGLEVARRLRALPDGKNLMLIAISGYGQAEMKERASSAGYDEFLTKPISAVAVATLIKSAPDPRSGKPLPTA